MDCLFLAPGCGPTLTAQTPVYWLPGDGPGHSLALRDCAAASQGRPLALVLPIEVASAFAVSLPTQKIRWLRQALPYAVEELLAEDVEQLHLALGERMADGRYRVIAVRRTLLAGWLKQLEEVGLPVSGIYLDADLLPREHSQLLLLDGRALLGGSGEARLALGGQAWPELLAQLPTPVTICGPASQMPPGIDDYLLLAEPYQWLAQGRTAAVDLAQGEFAVKPISHGLRPWKPLLAVAGVWLLLQLGINLGQTWYLQRQGDAYAAASWALYQQLFPDDTRIVNLRAQVDEHLARGRVSASGFLPLLSQAASALGAAAGVSVEQVEYSASRGDLALQVRAADFAALEQLRQNLGEAGLNVQLGSATREERGVTARVVIGG